MRNTAAGLISLCLPLLLSGCSTCKPNVETRIIKACPVQPVPLTAYPQLDGTNNEALLRLVAGYEAALRKCNADKMMINDALKSSSK